MGIEGGVYLIKMWLPYWLMVVVGLGLWGILILLVSQELRRK